MKSELQFVQSRSVGRWPAGAASGRVGSSSFAVDSLAIERKESCVCVRAGVGDGW